MSEVKFQMPMGDLAPLERSLLEAHYRDIYQKGYELQEENIRLQSLLDKEWVSVTERLPEFSVPVLCFCSMHGRFVGSFEPIANTNHGEWWGYENHGGILPPTHWQPLPPPPPPKDSKEEKIDG